VNADWLGAPSHLLNLNH